MAAQGHANLHHGGGGCSPYPRTHADVFNPELKTPNTAGFGSDPTWSFSPNVDGYLYDQPDISKTQRWPTTLECAKGAGYIALSRQLHFGAPNYSTFRLDEDSRQKDLWRWFIENQDNIVPDYCLNVIMVPMCIELEAIYIKTNIGVPGLTFDVVDFYTDTVLMADVDVSDNYKCQRQLTIPAAMGWSDECNRMLSLKLKTVPPKQSDPCKPGKGLLDGLNMEISAKVYCPWSGE